MKTTKLAAVGIIGLTAFGLATTTAQAATTTSIGDVTFNTNLDSLVQPPIKTTEIENPGNGSGNEGADADLYISYVTDFNFGQVDYNLQQVGSVTGDVYTAGTFAAPGVYQPVTPEGQPKPDTIIKDALGISIVNTNAIKGWSLKASATKFANGTDTINGMVMTIPTIASRQVVGDETAVTVTPKTPVQLLQDGAGEGVDADIATYTNNVTDPVMSVTNLAFGSYTDPAQGAEETYNGVGLYIPANRTVKDDVTYTSNITWTLESSI